MDDEGYQNQHWWRTGGFWKNTGPEGWDEQLQHPSWPVTAVSWHEAAAYCAWAGVRLPSHQHREQAACGPEGRQYPWGSEPPDEKRANFGKKVGSPTPVGLYPAGATREGVADMAGNIWEWVEDRHRDKARGVRGGSFSNDADYLRAAHNSWVAPRFRHLGALAATLVKATWAAPKEEKAMYGMIGKMTTAAGRRRKCSLCCCRR